MADRDRLVATIHAAACRGEFEMRLTVSAIVATVPVLR
jgi:hypothetical protein